MSCIPEPLGMCKIYDAIIIIRICSEAEKIVTL